MEFQTLSQEHALCIADTWHYDGIYEFYDMTADPEDYAEFVDEIQRSKNDHYEALQDGLWSAFSLWSGKAPLWSWDWACGRTFAEKAWVELLSGRSSRFWRRTTPMMH